MGSLLIATGIFIYTWISGIHYSFLKRQDASFEAPPELIFKSLIWPLLHITPTYDPVVQDIVE